ncbi:hypothetical protein AGMMS49965_20130 [Bacteroidia bacterium]|nr:hypothetical protein AGMMS49965_20130 [Bacteroidia bacterium]
MDEKHVIASAIADNELVKAFSELVAERWDNFDVSPFMAYLVDTCEASALPYLAEQFDCAGLQGFAMATNIDEQRELIKRSIALHKFVGTPWAIRESIRTIGFPVIKLNEGVTDIDPDTDWATFSVWIEANVNKHITAEMFSKLKLFIGFYKNERSHLFELGFYQILRDVLFQNPIENRDVLRLSIYMPPIQMNDNMSFDAFMDNEIDNN